MSRSSLDADDGPDTAPEGSVAGPGLLTGRWNVPWMTLSWLLLSTQGSTGTYINQREANTGTGLTDRNDNAAVNNESLL